MNELIEISREAMIKILPDLESRLAAINLNIANLLLERDRIKETICVLNAEIQGVGRPGVPVPPPKPL